MCPLKALLGEPVFRWWLGSNFSYVLEQVGSPGSGKELLAALAMLSALSQASKPHPSFHLLRP